MKRIPVWAFLVMVAFSGNDSRPLIERLKGLLTSSIPEAQQAALEWTARDDEVQDAQLVESIFTLYQQQEDRFRSRALRNMGWIYEKTGDGRAFQAVLNALKGENPTLRTAALEVVKGSAQASGKLHRESEILATVAGFLRGRDPALRRSALDIVAASTFLMGRSEVLQGVSAVFSDTNLTLRSAAADILIESYESARPKARAEPERLLRLGLGIADPNVRRKIAVALGLAGPGTTLLDPSSLLATHETAPDSSDTATSVPFDFNYFTAFVQPLFVKSYPQANKMSCISCHTPAKNASGAFEILEPDSDGRYTLEQSRANFASALRVVDLQKPVESLLLLKPLNWRAPEGKRGLTHDGGVFWDSTQEPDYQLVEAWLQRETLPVAPRDQLDFLTFAHNLAPILAQPASDGSACVTCHTTHALLYLVPPDPDTGQFTGDQLRINYESAHKVVTHDFPENSYLVRKPVSPREGSTGGISHAGGQRWPAGTESEEFRTLLAWIKKKNLAE